MVQAEKQLVLASASPRREELLRQAGYAFMVVPPDFHEPSAAATRVDPVSTAEALSFFKARTVARRLSGATVIGADTVVSSGEMVYGKPADEAQARRILADLMHHSHQVITGVALVDADTGRREITCEVTRVTMRPMPDDVFDEYLRSRRWEGKAGAYGIQDHGDAFVERVEGSFSNVVGLPMELLTRLLTAWDHRPVKADGLERNNR